MAYNPKTKNVEEKKSVKKAEVNDNEKDEHVYGGMLGATVGGITGGIAAGMAAGAAYGTPGGPIGAVAGAALGGAIGGVAGQDLARDLNPTDEEAYWEKHYHTRDYVRRDVDFEHYRPAYRYGIDAYSKYAGQSFEDLEPSLRNNWGIVRGKSKLEWEEAREAARDAFNKLDNSVNDI